jgi:hypothetical protein
VRELHVIVLRHSSLQVDALLFAFIFSDDNVSGTQFINQRVSRQELNYFCLLVRLRTRSNIGSNVKATGALFQGIGD